MLIKPIACLIDCKTVGFFLKISKEIGKAWRMSFTRAKRVFSLVQDLLFDCSRVLEYAKIRTVLQSTCLTASHLNYENTNLIISDAY